MQNYEVRKKKQMLELFEIQIQEGIQQEIFSAGDRN